MPNRDLAENTCVKSLAELLVAIPAFNEAATIVEVIATIPKQSCSPKTVPGVKL